MISGVEGKQFLVNNRDDAEEVASAVEAACKEVLGRTGGAGFPLLCDDYSASQILSLKDCQERGGESQCNSTHLSRGIKRELQ